MLAASPAVAERIGASSRHMFFLKQVFYLALAAVVMVVVSLLSPRGVRRFALLGCAGALVLTAATLVLGAEIKGARRWLSLPGLSLQPSEFLKPFFAVVAAWLIAEGWHVVLADVDRTRGTRVAKALGEQAWFVALDVSQESQVQVAVAEVLGQFGRLDAPDRRSQLPSQTRARGV
jgi:cell division protein FtsW (lipid II flippase)